MALAVAAVVVANPIVVPRTDVQIPSVKLSAGTDDAAGMLDQAFLDAIAPAPESTNPFSVLKDLISSLAADATSLGRNVILDAFVAGITAVSEPELTAFSKPYSPPLSGSPEPAMSVLSGIDTANIAGILPSSGMLFDLPDPVSLVNEKIAPAVSSFVSTLVSDVGFVGGELVAAAFAAGAMVANEPKLIGDTLAALVRGDLNGALHNAVKVVFAPLVPPAIVAEAVRTVIEKHLAAVSGLLSPEQIRPVQAPTTAAETAAAAVSVADAQPTVDLQSRGGRTLVTVLPTVTDIAVPPAAAVLGSGEIRERFETVPQVDAQAPGGGSATGVTPRRAVATSRDAVKPAGKAAARGRSGDSAAASD